VLFKPVTIARDLGRDIELASGISPDDRVIVAPPDGIADGDQVRVAGGVKDGSTAKNERQCAVASVRSARQDGLRGKSQDGGRREVTREEKTTSYARGRSRQPVW